MNWLLLILFMKQSLSFSPITRVELRGHEIFIKRDDLILTSYLTSPQTRHSDTSTTAFHKNVTNFMNGNKIRKFKNLSKLASFPTSIASHGGLQSNSLVALAELCSVKNSTFHYYTTAIPEALKHNPIGNYGAALKLGVVIHELTNDEYTIFKADDDIRIKEYLNGITWIPRGGAMAEAEDGLNDLADELAKFILDSDSRARWKVLVESGTGSTALFVFQRFQTHYKKLNIDVIALPCVGRSAYLTDQMVALDREVKNLGLLPMALSTPIKRVFAKPYPEHLSIWLELQKSTGITFDLVYSPRAFEQLFWSFENNAPLWEDCKLIYVHCGGNTGNESQLLRYKYNSSP
jgi:1-aminocyclopropane-1-carboxylate deaminase